MSALEFQRPIEIGGVRVGGGDPEHSEPAFLRSRERHYALNDLFDRTIVEGIETAEQVVQLRRLGCRFGQGYYFGRPVPAEETVALLNSPLPSA